MKLTSGSLLVAAISLQQVAAVNESYDLSWYSSNGEDGGAIMTGLKSTMILPTLSNGTGLHYVWPILTGNYQIQSGIVDDKQWPGQWSFASLDNSYTWTADNSTAPIIGYPGDSLVTNFELDVESGNWTDTWRFMPNNTGLNPQRYSNGGVVDLGFPDQENLWMASFGIILEQNGTWDFGPQTWTDITITANSTDATWCTSPQIGSDTFNYTMSEPQGNVTANGTSTCYIAKLTFQYPEPSTDDADSSDDSPDNSNDTDSSDDSSDADSSDYVDSSDDYAY